MPQAVILEERKRKKNEGKDKIEKEERTGS
jgi:hypothetical protein